MTLREFLVIGAFIVIAVNLLVLVILMILSIWSARQAPNYWEQS
jgi:hypothetical protein